MNPIKKSQNLISSESLQAIQITPFRVKQFQGPSEVLFHSYPSCLSRVINRSLWCLRQFPHRVFVWIRVISAALRPGHSLIKCTLVPDLAMKTSIFPCLSNLLLSSLTSKLSSLCLWPSFLFWEVTESSTAFPSICLWSLLVAKDCHHFPT